MRRYPFAFLLMATLFVSSTFAQLSDEDLAALQAKGKVEGWTFSVGRNPATDRPMNELCGLVVPKDWRTGARFTMFEAKAGLPASFDWRAYGACTPVKAQGGCGSCWAFGTVGPLESNILIEDGVVVDLSEQWLVSCNQETEPPIILSGVWGCDGGWWAHDYHQGAMTDPCGGWGAVLEADFPYAEADLPCDCPYPHAYTIHSWAYIGPEEGIPETDAIKQAILAYGPVSAAVYVEGAFAGYTGGVFNGSVDEEPNHAVVLVGWDDAQGSDGVWILRNSWSTLWGEGGYMRIEYRCSNVGLGACYVDYTGHGGEVGPEITSQPAGGHVAPGWSYEFTIEATGLGDLHYEWQRDGEPVGGDSPTLLIENASPEDEGVYVCDVLDARGSTPSHVAALILYSSEALPVAGAGALCVLAALCLFGVGLATRNK